MGRPGRRRGVLGMLLAVLLLAGCGSGSGARGAAAHPSVSGPTTPGSLASGPPITAITVAPTTVPPTTSPATITAQGPSGGPGTFGPLQAGVLSGKIVALDPGHNGGNAAAASTIDAPIFNGRSSEACDTAGASTDAGYTEAAFNFAVASDLAELLRNAGATVVLTRTSNAGVGPCVTERAAIGNQAHADVALSIHADGGPASGRGFAILEPVADGPNDGIITASDQFAGALRTAFASGTGEPVSTYDGVDGLQARDDLGGTNLSTVPKVFIECANMRNSTDAALVASPAWQAEAAQAIAAGITAFLSPSG